MHTFSPLKNQAYQKGCTDSTVRVLSLFVHRLSGLILVIFVLFLTACQSNWAPVSDINRANPKLSGEHIVQTGETLYAIGWRYNRDFKELARVNEIAPPYVIHVGQKISLAPEKSKPKVMPVQMAQNPMKAAQPVSAPSVTTTPSTAHSPVQQANVGAPPARLASVTPPAPAAATHTLPTVVRAWKWPVKGDIIAGFAQSKGIDIAGTKGEIVHACADGRVVYSGNGLRGYGQLLIIKHNEQFLSAYAHNSQLIVKEGDWVKLGQPIAEMGDTDTTRVKLHFEIRKDGKPVDPLKYLPG